MALLNEHLVRKATEEGLLKAPRTQPVVFSNLNSRITEALEDHAQYLATIPNR